MGRTISWHLGPFCCPRARIAGARSLPTHCAPSDNGKAGGPAWRRNQGRHRRKESEGGAGTAAPKAQGTTTKRTPTGAFDPAAGKDTYEPEAVVAERLSKGVTQYQVKWVGWSTPDNPWEPIEHLAGKY